MARWAKALDESLNSPVAGGDVKERPWNGKVPLSGFKSSVSQVRIGRKLGDIHQELVLLGEQGKITDVENAEKLGGPAEDVHDVLIDYRVYEFFLVLKSLVDVIATAYLQRAFPAHRQSRPVIFLSRAWWLTGG